MSDVGDVPAWRRPRSCLALVPVTLLLILAAWTWPAEAGADTTLPEALAQDAQSAAEVATDAGYRTGIGVIDVQTGAYVGAGQDTAQFASESIVKVMIAAQLLLTGQMTGTTESTAYTMITQSDDEDADALYGLVGGDDLITEIAAHYNIPWLGSPPDQAGWWGNTEITARGMADLYAALAKDPLVGPWLTNAMAHTSQVASDGTDQLFGVPAANPSAASKQGWGDDGDDSPNAVFNSTGYVGNGAYAVVILTDGPPSTYGTAISAMVTAQAHALMPTGTLDDPATHNPTLSGIQASAVGNTVHVTGTAADPDQGGAPVTVSVAENGTVLTQGMTDGSRAFDLTFTAHDGAHSFAVTAHNIGEGTADTSVSTGVIAVDGDPTGMISAVTAGPGLIRVVGRESDPNLADGQVPALTVMINGAAPTALFAAPSTATGPATIDATIPAPTGRDTVTVTFTATGDARDAPAGTWTLTVPRSPAPIPRQDGDREFVQAGLDAGSGLMVLAIIVVPYRRWRNGRRRSPTPDPPRC